LSDISSAGLPSGNNSPAFRFSKTALSIVMTGQSSAMIQAGRLRWEWRLAVIESCVSQFSLILHPGERHRDSAPDPDARNN
jgi:hypothetical protein